MAKRVFLLPPFPAVVFGCGKQYVLKRLLYATQGVSCFNRLMKHWKLYVHAFCCNCLGI